MRPSFTVLALCSDMLLLCGVMLGGKTTWGFLRMSYYWWTTHLGVELASCAILVAAALLSLPVCWVVLVALQRPNTRIVPFYITLMCLLSSGMLLTSVGMTALSGVMRSVHSPRFNHSMTRALTHVTLDPMVYTSFSAMQTELKCCGVRSYKDWYGYRSTLPSSCCALRFQYKKRNFTKCSVPLYTRGCLHPAQAELSSFLTALSVYSASGLIVMAVTLFVAAYMFVTETEDGGVKQLSTMRLTVLPNTPSYTYPANPANLANLATLAVPTLTHHV